MSNPIDQRIVEMRFDNANFEKNTKQTLNTLDQLKNGLNLESSVKNINSLSKAADGFSLSGMATGIDHISSRFSALGVVGFTVMQNLTNSAINLGKKMVGAVVDPLVSGGKRRALNIQQAKFQFEGLGMDVEATMESANQAVLGTAYGLDDAAKLASQLGASGMRAGEEMTSALRGTAGVAAMTSSSYEDMGRIFATVAGNGRLMGDQLNQLAARGLNAAATLGTAYGKTEKQIREMVSKGQISFEMFYKAMDQAYGEHATSANKLYSGALSNMKAALGRIGADVASDAFMNLRDIFNALTPRINDTRKALEPLIANINRVMKAVTSSVVDRLTNLDMAPLIPSLQVVTNLFQALERFVKPVRKAFQNVFPEKTTDQLVKSAEALVVLTEGFKMGGRSARQLTSSLTLVLNVFKTFGDGLKNIVRGLSGLFDPIKRAFLDVFTVEEFEKIVGVFQKIADSFNRLTGNFILGEKATNGVYQVFKALFTVIKFGIELFANLANGAMRIAEGVSPLTDHLVRAVGALGSFVTYVTQSIDVTNLFGSAIDTLTSVFSPITKLFSGMNKVLPTFARLASGASEVLGTLFGKIGELFAKADTEKTFEIIHGGLLAGVLIGIEKFINTVGNFIFTAGGLAPRMKRVFRTMQISLENFQNRLKADILLRIAGAVVLLAAAMLVLSRIDSDKLVGTIAAMTSMFVQLFGSLAVFQKLMGGGGLKQMRGLSAIASAMTGMAVAVLILSSAMTKLSGLSWGEIGRGLTAMTGLMALLTATTIILSKNKGKLKSATSFVIFAAAIAILATSLEKLGKLDIATIGKGLLGLAGVMGMLVAFTQTVKKGKLGVTMGVGLVLMATSLIIFAEALERIGSIDILTLGKGLGTVALSLTMVTAAVNLMPKGMVGIGVGLIGVATALVILSVALERMGRMSLEEIGKGLLVLGGSLGIIALSMLGMKSALPGAAALLVISAALAILAPVLRSLGEMSLVEIGKSLLVLAGAFGVLGLAALVLTPVVPTLLGLGAAVALIGVGSLALGAGLLAVSAGLSALAISGAAGVTSLVVAITAIIGLIPVFMTKLAESFITFLQVIVASSDAIKESTTKLLEMMLATFSENIPKILDVIGEFLTDLKNRLIKAIPEIADAALQIIIGILQAIEKRIGDITKLAIKIVVNFINGITEMLPDVIDAGFDLLVGLITGMSDAIRTNAPIVLDAIGELIVTLLDTAADIVGAPIDGAISIGKAIVEGIGQGIKDFGKGAIDSIKGFGSGLIKGLQEKLGIASPSKVMRDEVGRFIVQGIAVGITEDMSAEQAAAKKAQNIVNAFKDALNSIDIRSATYDLEHELWSALTGTSASDSDRSMRELNVLTEKFRLQQEKVELAQAEHKTMTDNMHADSDEVRSSYNRYLQEQITLAEINNQIVEINNQINQSRRDAILKNRDAANAYYDFLAQNNQALLDLGFAQEEIEKTARSRTGFDPDMNMLETTMSSTAGKAVETAMNTVETVYEDKAATVFGELTTSFGEWGSNYATSLGDGFVYSFDAVLNKIREKLTEMEVELENRLKSINARLQSVMGLETSPTIKPVIDLSNVVDGAKNINSMLKNTKGLSVAATLQKAEAANQATRPLYGKEEGSETKAPVSFVQNNYSPKALSRIEIYRDTKNLFSNAKGVVTA